MKSKEYAHHISGQYNAELEEVRTHFLAMGGLVEKQVTDSINGERCRKARRVWAAQAFGSRAAMPAKDCTIAPKLGNANT